MVTDERTNQPTDGRRKGQVENIMPAASPYWHTDKNSMFADGIAFECFYDAERVLYAIAKFLVHLIGKEEGRGEMGGGSCRRRQWG